MNKQILFIGFMLFALFFGAGNLIYPPILGMEAGTSYWSAMLGFILTGVGLPILAIAAIAYISNQSTAIGHRVHPSFGVIFTSIIYLAIGPFFGIPRAANVGFEMGVFPLFADRSLSPSFLLAGFTVIFFLIVFWLSLNPTKLVDRVGQFLTPALVFAIAALSIGAFTQIEADIQPPTEKYQSNPFFKGFIEGYLTMDAIAALAFGIIVVTSLNKQGHRNRKQLLIATIKAGLVSGLALTAVYGSIGWIGARMATMGDFNNGGEILSTAAFLVYGEFGKVILGIIVALACLTTSVGLTVACGQYFSQKTKFGYKSIVTVVTLASLLIANLGLNQIIAFSVPVLVTIYPISIVLVVLTFMNTSRRVYQFAVLFTAIVSMLEGLQTFGVSFQLTESLLAVLPLSSLGLAWLIPAIIGGVTGRVLERNN